MWTYAQRAALCSLGLTMLACGDPATQPNASTESEQSTPLSTTVTGTWRRMPSLVPARAGMAAAVSDKSILVVGGWVFGSVLRRVDAYNVETRTWTQLKSLPEPRAAHGATTINGKIYVAGGVTRGDDPNDPQPTHEVPHKSLFVYDPGTDTWTRKADMPHPAYESFQANILGRLYVYVPGNGSSPDYFFAYTPRIDKWVSLRRPPSRHTQGVVGVIDGKLYLTNGVNSEGSFNRELDVYDPATRTWEIKRAMLGADGGGVAAVFHGKLWVAGNEDALYSARDVQVYDPRTDEWRRGPLMLSNSRFGAAAWAGEKFYVLGGTDLGYVTSVVQALTTSY